MVSGNSSERVDDSIGSAAVSALFFAQGLLRKRHNCALKCNNSDRKVLTRKTHMKTQLKSAFIITAFIFTSFVVNAQTSDALLNKLVSKGILTQQEADDLKKESDGGFEKAYRTRAGLPEWVTSLRLYGDLRGRFDGIYVENDAHGSPNRDRNRLRYRLRVGATATFKDNLDLGFRFTSGEPQGGFGGDSISSNTSFQDNGSKKFFWVDLAYGRWTPIKNDTWQLSGTIGKIENPFVFSPIVFDDDYTPEGIGLSSTYNISKHHSLKFAGGFFWLDEISQGGQSDHDPFLLGVQARWDGRWNETLESSVGVGVLTITDERSLTNFSVPNLNVGNTRMADGTLAEEFTPVVFDASVTYLLEPLAGYKTRFPLKLGGLVIHNPVHRMTTRATSWVSPPEKQARRVLGTCRIAGAMWSTMRGSRNSRTPTSPCFTRLDSRTLAWVPVIARARTCAAISSRRVIHRLMPSISVFHTT